MIHSDHYVKKNVPLFFCVWLLLSHFRYSSSNKVIGQSPAPTSRLLYDEKKRQKATENGSEILCVHDFFCLFFKFSYLPVNNCYHVLGSLQRDSMPKLQIYYTSSGHHVQFLKRAKENNISSTGVVLSQ